ncbi:cellular tumor antigen p53-like [Planococcus citri]|uniref:cellular tumor antigen p53-like n=1 Tax=Planococcus citri TaxID=170843 RepID=UPI0031F9BE23
MCDSSNNYLNYMLPPTTSIVSSSTGVFPSINDFAGDLNFEIILNPNETIKKKWLFSEKLKKVFIDINKNIGIRFRWNNMNMHDVKFIRALPVYTQDDWLRIPVERCPMHKCYEDNLNIDFPWVNHVLRCDNEGTQYEIDLESKRRSCITPVTMSDYKDIVVLYFKFVCKTSCYRGMQRRPIVVIFTLEDGVGNVLGRRCLSFKVCSCLKRDLHREEFGKRKTKNSKSAVAVSHSQSANNTLALPERVTHGGNRFGRHSLKLTRLNPAQLEYALKLVHNTLLGESVRNSYEVNHSIIAQIEKYLNRLRNSQHHLQ